MRVRNLGLALLVIGLGCKASAPEPGTAQTNALAVVRTHPELARVLARSRAAAAVPGVAVPRAANQPLRLSKDDLSIEILADGLSDARATFVDGAAVYSDVALDTDLIELVEPGRVEELRVLRSPRAPTTATWTLHLAAGMTARLQGSSAQVLDAAGSVRFSTEPAFALDALGVRRDLELRLEGDRLVAALDPRGLRYPIVLDPAWVSGGTMVIARTEHTQTLLPSGKVLVTGGLEGTDAGRSTAELYDPATNTWTATGSMRERRRQHVAIPTTSGTVLVAGGYGPISSAEMYAGSSFYSIASMPLHSVNNYLRGVPLKSGGSALVVVTRLRTFSGGFAFEPYPMAYNGGWVTWPLSPVGGLPSWGYTLTLLDNGKVLLAGGGGSTRTMLIDPVTVAWQVGPDLAFGRHLHSATLLPNGKVLITGGTGAGGGPSYNNAELYDPSVAPFGAFTTLAPMKVARHGHATTLLNGNAILIGGLSGSTAISDVEVFDPMTSAFTSIASMAMAHPSVLATELLNGKVLVTGGSSAEVYADQAQGRACLSTAECRSGLTCVDGVCCSTACTESCRACDVVGSVGTCTDVASGVPHGTRTCGGGAYLCSAGACLTSCTGDTSCTSTHWCSSGSCVAKKANGATCAGGNECTSSNCADGVCCDKACSGQCEACNVTGTVGTCTPVTGAPRGTRTACGGAGVGTACASVCDGVDPAVCHYPTTSTACSENACKVGIETHASGCNGAGACSDVAKPCGAYACGVVACKTACVVNGDCAAGHYCKAGACTAVEGLGTACTDASSCTSTYCVDGVCCGEESCGAGRSCALPGHLGTCFKRDGSTCASGAECGSGFCVDGVCCESECKAQCQACDVTGALGRCVAVTGAVHGARAACAKDATDACGSKLCDGVAIDSCAAFVGSDVTCREAGCADGVATAGAKCDGSGKCPTAITSSCEGFKCEPDGKACKTICTSADDCTTGNDCFAAKCTPKKETCSTDGASIVRTDGTTTPCAPFVCKAGACVTACGASSDCSAGLVCDVPTATCIAPTAATPPTEDDGGCAMGNRGTTAAWVLVAIVAAMARRRRKH